MTGKENKLEKQTKCIPTIRRLTDQDSGDAADLLSVMSTSPADVLRHHRNSENFFKYYHFIGDGDYTFWGAFDNQSPPKLIGKIGYVSKKVQFPLAHVPVYFHGDSIIRNEYRSLGIYGKLVAALARHVKVDPIPSVYFALENEVGTLDLLTETTKKLDQAEIVFCGKSTLIETYLHKDIIFSANQKVEVEVESATVTQLDSTHLERFISGVKQSSLGAIFYPVVDKALLLKCAQTDPNCTLLLAKQGGDIRAGMMLLDVSHHRRFVFTGNNSIVTESIRRKRLLSGQPPLLPGQQIKFMNICFHWNSPGEENCLTELLRYAYQMSYRNGFDAILMRDLDEELLPQEWNIPIAGGFPNIYNYKRRIMVQYMSRDTDLFDPIFKNQSRYKLDASFV